MLVNWSISAAPYGALLGIGRDDLGQRLRSACQCPALAAEAQYESAGRAGIRRRDPGTCGQARDSHAADIEVSGIVIDFEVNALDAGAIADRDRHPNCCAASIAGCPVCKNIDRLTGPRTKFGMLTKGRLDAVTVNIVT